MVVFTGVRVLLGMAIRILRRDVRRTGDERGAAGQARQAALVIRRRSTWIRECRLTPRAAAAVSRLMVGRVVRRGDRDNPLSHYREHRIQRATHPQARNWAGTATFGPAELRFAPSFLVGWGGRLRPVFWVGREAGAQFS